MQYSHLNLYALTLVNLINIFMLVWVFLEIKYSHSNFYELTLVNLINIFMLL